jgi:hypothetical protein
MKNFLKSDSDTDSLLDMSIDEEVFINYNKKQRGFLNFLSKSDDTARNSRRLKTVSFNTFNSIRCNLLEYRKSLTCKQILNVNENDYSLKMNINDTLAKYK